MLCLRTLPVQSDAGWCAFWPHRRRRGLARILRNRTECDWHL